MLPPEILSDQAQLTPNEAVKAIMGTPLREARETFEREYLRVQIRRFSGNISRTANFIGMERSALHRKLKALGLADTRGEERIAPAKLTPPTISLRTPCDRAAARDIDDAAGRI